MMLPQREGIAISHWQVCFLSEAVVCSSSFTAVIRFAFQNGRNSSVI